MAKNDHNATATKTAGGKVASLPPKPGEGCQCEECGGKLKAPKAAKE